MLYELVTGSPPFTGDSPVAVAYQHVRENANPPSSINPDVPQVLDAIVLKAMAKNPANRYQSAAEMRADLGRAMSGRTVLAEPVMSADERTTVMGGTGLTQAMGEPEPETSNRRKAGYVALALAVILIIAGGSYGVYKLVNNGKKKDGGNTQAQQVPVPSLTNLTKKAAQTKLDSAGLKAKYATAVSSAALKNRVTKTQPLADTQVDKGSTVTVTIGQGPNTIAIPTLKGTPRGTAVTVLRSQGFTVGQVRTINPDGPGEAKNTVIRTDPVEGSQVQRGATVNLDVSNGFVQMPNLFGLSLDEARNKLVQAGFTSEPQSHEKTSTLGPAESVVGQSVQNGTYVNPSTVVTIAIAKPKATTTPTTNPPTSNTPTSAPPSNTPSASNTPSGSNSPSLPVGPG
jgi:serine/threonine-protein kinase